MRTDSAAAGPWTDVLPAEAPVAHRNLRVTVGARQFTTTLTRDHLLYWLNKLPYVSGGSFMTVARTGQDGFIQTYRNNATDYLLEVHPGVEDGQYLQTTLDDLDRVAQLIWDWLQDDRVRLDEIDWAHRSF
ncbi:hypothetical protein AB0L57_04040 [Nocardia sp. NPDC052254]|uniref:hypothetical protein n=1 Tax=Nocardia sp. NPDC052254 TaxID=3155681 RepID=UPI003416F70B